MADNDADGKLAAATESFRKVLGSEFVLVDSRDREFYSTDLSFLPRHLAGVVIQPGSIDQLSAAVRIASEAGIPILARGGGMSYTGGYIPEKPGTVLVDMRRMSRILEINTEDLYVTVECGCTWKQLYEALQAKGVRTPYYGPLSGMYATIGGALSQNSLFLGSGIHHTVAESVLGLQVVLADGRVLQTGSAAHRHSNAFWRHFGPDVTGLFTADTGAFGFKAVATLRLIQTPPATGLMSFKFDRLDSMLSAQTQIARLNICSECYGFDPYYNAGFEKQGIKFKEGLSVVGKVIKKRGAKGLATAAKMALKGRSLLHEVPYSLHMTVDAIDDEAADAALAAARKVCLAEHGVEMDNVIPSVFRAQPFGGVRTVLLGSEGELWIPVHGFFPLSRAVAAGEATERWLAQKRPTLEKWNIRTSYLTCFSGAEFVIEPSFYWHDELGPFRLSLIEAEFAEKWKTIPADLEKRRVVLQLRQELRDLFDGLGGLHLQIGKYYPYRDVMGNETLWQVLNGLKTCLDPQRLVNPGSLGLR